MVAANSGLLGFSHRRLPAGRFIIADWLTRGLWFRRGIGGLWESGVKWRCLKEQREKFAITMTVNIQLLLFVSNMMGLALKAWICSGNDAYIFFVNPQAWYPASRANATLRVIGMLARY